MNDLFKKSLIIFTTFIAFSYAQVHDPISFESTVNVTSDNEATIIVKPIMEGKWHIYSQYMEEGGPNKTELKFESSQNIELVGKTEEKGKVKRYFDEIFEMEVAELENGSTFNQKLKFDKLPLDMNVSVSYQACKDGMCLPLTTKKIQVKVGAKNDKPNPEIVEKPTEKDTKVSNDVELVTEKDAISTSDIGAKDSLESFPLEDTLNEEIEHKDVKSTSVTSEASSESDTNLWRIFILGFLGGFAALLMPCVFPIIPMTVSFFTKQSKSKSDGIKKALIYGLAIIVIYVLLGSVITIMFGSNALNLIASNPWVNFAFFVVFLLFAISLFGAFEIVLPSSLVNAMDKNSDKGGLLGIFFMAFTLALVSFSCTGPIIGGLLVDAATSGSRIGPMMGMFGFSLALAIPFTLFAIFPGMLNSLPKSGGWMNMVKVSLGFIELAFAFKFLSNADLVWKRSGFAGYEGWLNREIFIAIWIGIFLLWTLYLLGIFKMSHDSDNSKVNTTRLLFSAVSLAFVFYMIPGLNGAPLKVLSGLIPPSTYSELNSYGDHIGPHGIPVFHDYDEGVEYAKSIKKPIMLDFTGDSCANCRKMEDKVWSNPEIKRILSEDVVVISLYIDDRKPLPKNKVFTSEYVGEVDDYGKYWTDFEIKHFNKNSQPLYVIQDYDLNNMNEVIGVEYNISNYKEWLEKGINEFQKR